ncbi:DUF2478 domain-containing protein [Alkalilacustris brevis]|uniref:DUF2478 domain-containing protein n=1 Tax=Alkalilacustris brevis TaxID=2026338 RepID=UPI000E0D934F|nr:DUF2478 domain-containing protein [Alkalilacustris brevis]
MLGYVRGAGRGAADRLLTDVAQTLIAQGWPVAAAVQVNVERFPDRPCDMELHVLSVGEVVRISQHLGPQARGCRLDPAGLEQAVGLLETALAGQPRLMIINKFGKQEAEGRGFRPLIGQALAAGVPVLTAVSAANHTAFEAFADGMAEQLPDDRAAVLAWCRNQEGAAA